jgi:hypothetical protein
MLRRALLTVCLVSLCLAASAQAGGFDCAKPSYGAPLSSMNDNNYFVKFMEKDGVDYYNYTGPCKLGIHERLAPVIVYGVVDGKLFSRLMKTENDDIEIIKQVTFKLAGTPKTTTSGDWTVMSWDFPEKNIKMKLKYNNVTKVSKSAIYYEALRPGKESNENTEDALDK